MKEYPAVTKCKIGQSQEKTFVTASFSGPDGLVAEFGVAKDTWLRMLTGLVFSALALGSEDTRGEEAEEFQLTVHPKNVPMARVGLGRLDGDVVLTVGVGSCHIPFRIELEQLKAVLNQMEMR